MDWKWIIGIAGALIAFFVGEFHAVHGLNKTIELSERTIESTQRIEMFRLARDLTREFYEPDPKLFQRIRTSLESCQNIYASWGGKFKHDEINRYLGFFDDLGFLYKEKLLDLKIIDQLFGAFIIESYENNELRKYIDDLKANAHQPQAFADYVALAQALEKLPDRTQLLESARRGCDNAQKAENARKAGNLRKPRK
jgi:hypothetical protein